MAKTAKKILKDVLGYVSEFTLQGFPQEAAELQVATLLAERDGRGAGYLPPARRGIRVGEVFRNLMAAQRLAEENAELSIKLSGLLTAVSGGELSGSLWSLGALEAFATEYLEAAHSRGVADGRLAAEADAQDRQWQEYRDFARRHWGDIPSVPASTLMARLRDAWDCLVL